MSRVTIRSLSPRSAPVPLRIVLVGFMGSGKSTVGARLAGELAWEFCDLDARIEQRTGLAVAEIFRTQGEAFFRAQEALAAEELSARAHRVIATGGGAFVRPETRAHLSAGAFTVWLRCPLDIAFRRVGGDPSRPLAGSHEKMKALLAEREPSYRLADLTIDTSRSTPTEAALAIKDSYEERFVRGVGER